MKAKIKYTDEQLGNLRIVNDFLPPPEELVFKEDNVKITITLSKTSFDFFKKESKKYQTEYQKMIMSLLEHYAFQYQNKSLTR